MTFLAEKGYQQWGSILGKAVSPAARGKQHLANMPMVRSVEIVLFQDHCSILISHLVARTASGKMCNVEIPFPWYLRIRISLKKIYIHNLMA